MNTEKLDAIVARYEDLGREIADPEIIADTGKWSALCKEHTALSPVVEAYAEYKRAAADAEEARSLMGDADMKELAEEELVSAKKRMGVAEKELRVLLLPKDPDDGMNVVLEIRAGAGGEEAALFAAELARMYSMYADSRGWKWEELYVTPTELGGIKEAAYSVTGKDVYAGLKFESGVHRVQRVPETETQGRIHTSTVTVAVLPEAEDVSVDIQDKDLRIDTYRSSGAGGQHINKTDSAVRITHIPTGIVANCEDERSQTKNKEKAMKVLRARLYDHYKSIADKAQADRRRSQVGTGDRSERIRTYNFPQGRVTDHRIGLSMHNIGDFMNGNIGAMLDALRIADTEAKLGGGE